MSRLFPTCAEAARRISQAQEVPLPFQTRVGLYLHLAACSFCRRYLRQIRFLRATLREHGEKFDTASDQQLSEEARQRIAQALSKTP